jgi:hypothetical protein
MLSSTMKWFMTGWGCGPYIIKAEIELTIMLNNPMNLKLSPFILVKAYIFYT